MRKLILTIVFCFGALLSFGQKHDFVIQVMPQIGYISIDRMYEDGTLSSGLNVGFRSTVRYSPIARFAVGVESKSDLFYQFLIGLEYADFFAIIEHGIYDKNDFFSFDDGRFLKVGTITPIISLAGGYSWNVKNRTMIQSTPWSCFVLHRRDWKFVAFALGCGMGFNSLGAPIGWGPYAIGSKDYSWLLNRSFLFSAQIDVKLPIKLRSKNFDNNEMERLKKQSKEPKEF